MKVLFLLFLMIFSIVSCGDGEDAPTSVTYYLSVIPCSATGQSNTIRYSLESGSGTVENTSDDCTFEFSTEINPGRLAYITAVSSATNDGSKISGSIHINGVEKITGEGSATPPEGTTPAILAAVSLTHVVKVEDGDNTTEQ